jgi:hypothetical protein
VSASRRSKSPLQKHPQRLTRLYLLSTMLVLVAGLSLPACKEVESETAAGYEPSKLSDVKGKGDDYKQVTFTKEGADRVDLHTATVRRSESGTVIPYAALIYDDEGKTFVYTNPKPLIFLREPVNVDRIPDQRVLLSDGPPAGTKVVTVGATEVYGAELDIAASH